MVEKKMNAEASKEFLTHKLNVHLDLWAAEKWQLENLLFMAERAHIRKEVIQAYENAQLGVTLGFQQQDLLIANTKLEGALDDLVNCQTRVTTLQAQLQREKDNAKSLEEQRQAVEDCLASRERQYACKLADAGQKLQMKEETIQDLRQQVYTMKLRHEVEMMEEKSNTANCKAKVSKEMESLLRERDFVWNQLKCMEADYSRRIKAKDDLLESAKAEITRLQEVNELSQRAADEREVELTVLRVQLEKAEESLSLEPAHDHINAQKEDELRQALKRLEEVRLENENLRVLYAELEAKHDNQQRPDKASRASRKDPTTRNLSSELDAVAEASEHRKRCVSRKRREDKSSTKRKRSEDSGGKRRQMKDAGSSGRKALASSRNEEDKVMKTSLFSSSFSIPKVKDLSCLR